MAHRTCVVVVPGFKGTVLSQAGSGKPVWLTLRQALVGRASLAFDRPDLGVRNSVQFRPDGILKEIPIIPGILRKDIYASTLAETRKRVPADWQVRPWSYDWRDDPDTLVAELDAFVGSLVAEGMADVRILAHSMGGLLTSRWLLAPEFADGPARRVSRVCFVAAAFRGTTKMFRNLQIGDDPSGRNTTLLSADALGTFPSSYVFVPDAWPFAVDARGEPVSSKLRDVDLWESQRWGLFRDGREEFAGARRDFLADQFRRSRAFLSAVADPAAAPPPGLRVLNVVGVSGGTVDRLIQRADGTLVLSDAERRKDPALSAASVDAPGDSTIAEHAAELPPGLARDGAATVKLALEHMSVVQRGAGLDAALGFLLD
jgi:hypothetical protein